MDKIWTAGLTLTYCLGWGLRTPYSCVNIRHPVTWVACQLIKQLLNPERLPSDSTGETQMVNTRQANNPTLWRIRSTKTQRVGKLWKLLLIGSPISGFPMT